ncbi:MAG: adenylate/guanylate cyclase domain-containing protein [Desulforegulaceae bacterium]|nr:adenylate/guanylate cyclase domain-containing protein [Desulforegulaceae bacterium]
MKKKKYLYISAFILVSFGAVFSVFKFEVSPFFELAQKTDDSNFLLSKNTPNKNIVFAAVDEKSVNQFGRWPWSRAVLANGLKNLDQASVVLLDITFSETSTKEEDKYLSDTISKMNNVICGFFLRDKATEELDSRRKTILSFSSLERIKGKNISLPSARYAEVSIEPILKSCSMNAAFSTFPDKDGIFRNYTLGFAYNNSIYPTLGIQGLRFYLQEDLEIEQKNKTILANFSKHKLKFNKIGTKRLNYYDLDDYNHISFSDIINNKFEKAYFKNKIVIVGITEAGISDIRSTPIGAIPGPLLHYTFLSNVLNNDLIKEAQIYTIIPIFALSFFPLFCVFISKKIYLRIGLNLGAAFVFITFSKFLYVNSNVWVSSFYPFVALILSVFIAEAIMFRFHEKESFFIKEAFSAYVSPIILEKLAKHPEDLKLGGEEKEITILFLDIRNFTTISEKLESVELVNMLKELFNPFTKTIQDNNGFLDKYIGDAIMAFYNAPANVEDHAKMACKSALEMLRFINSKELKNKFDFDFDLSIGVGINTGMAVVGNTGADNRFNYTALGDSVNIASRLEGLNKTYGTNILISEFTNKIIGKDFLTRKIEEVKVKGKTKGVVVYELMENTQFNQKIKTLFEKALESGLKEDFEKCFNETGDKVSKIFIERNL